MKHIFCWSVAMILSIVTVDLIHADGAELFILVFLFAAAGVSWGAIWEGL